MDAKQVISRGTFLSRTGAALVGAVFATTSCLNGQTAAPGAHTWKGRKETNVKRWDVITIGNLSRNRFWGESDDKAVRNSICTSTLIAGEGFRLLVDPSLADAAEMFHALDRRTGVKSGDVTAVFVTHEHPDHYRGIAQFPDARWIAASPVAEILNQTAKLSRPVEKNSDLLFNAIKVIPTPGHTLAHHSLLFDCGGLRIVVAGDSVMTIDFFRDRRGYLNSVDFELSAKTIDRLATMADIIVPGHDNYFLADYVG